MESYSRFLYILLFLDVKVLGVFFSHIHIVLIKKELAKFPGFSCEFPLLLPLHHFWGKMLYWLKKIDKLKVTSQLNFLLLHTISTETPPPGYISEDGEASDQQMNQSMDTGNLD